MSNAFDMSRATDMVRFGGFWLKPVVIVFVMVCNAEVVECCFLYACWYVMLLMLLVMSGRRIFSRTLAMGERRDIGLYDVPLSFGFSGLCIGIILAVFQMVGIVLVFRDAL